MPLVVGTDTYISLTDAQTYLTTFGAEGAEVDEPSLAKATLAIDRLYRGRFKGAKTDEAQALEFPRDGATVIPTVVGQATAEMAALIKAGVNVYAQPDPLVLEEKVKVDVIETHKKFSAVGYYSNPLHQIQVILAPVLYASGGIVSAEVVRG